MTNSSKKRSNSLLTLIACSLVAACGGGNSASSSASANLGQSTAINKFANEFINETGPDVVAGLMYRSAVSSTLPNDAEFGDEQPENSITGVEVTDLLATPGDLVQGLSIQSTTYYPSDVSGRLLYDIELINNGTVAFPLGLLSLIVVNQAGFPEFEYLGIPDRIDEGKELLQPEETAIYREQLAHPGSASSLRIIIETPKLS